MKTENLNTNTSRISRLILLMLVFTAISNNSFTQEKIKSYTTDTIIQAVKANRLSVECCENAGEDNINTKQLTGNTSREQFKDIIDRATCETPLSVYTDNITHNSATINWTAPSPTPANGYTYYYSTNQYTTPPSVGTITNNTCVELTGLNSSTTYYIWIRSYCGNNNYSNWTSTCTFKTRAEPCNITNLSFSGSSRTPTLSSGFYYFDVCLNEILNLQVNSTCNDCGSTTDYTWLINAYDGNGPISYSGNNINYTIHNANGYDALLEIKGDNCYTSYPLRFRASDGPLIHSVSADIEGCSGSNTEINFGSEENTVHITPFEGEVTTTLGIGEETFIPDGPECENGNCYESSVTFTDFTPGSTIESSDDIQYVKINMEHTFIGDLQISLECPSGNSAIILQDYYTLAAGGLDNATYTWPYMTTTSSYGRIGFGESNSADIYASTIDACDGNLEVNLPGTGWDYCWSNNSEYSYANDSAYVYEVSNMTYNENFFPYYRVNASNLNDMTNIYHPHENFNSLIGCPLNGEWKIKVCDVWAKDNGWIFDWELSLNPDLMPVNWNYTVNFVNTDWSQITDADFELISLDPLAYNLIPNPGLTTGSYGGIFTVYDEFNCSSASNLNFNIQGIEPIFEIQDNDYIWTGFKGEEWCDDLNNWFVYDEITGYDYATTYPTIINNVHIIDYCSNPDPKINTSITSCKNLIISTGKSLIMSNTTPTQLNVSGNWHNEGTFNAGTSTINFNGTENQTINTSTIDGETFYNLTLNKNTGTILNSNQDIIIENQLTLSSGIINTNSNTVFLNNPDYTALIGGNTTGNDKYIDGKLQRATDGISTYTFPIGLAGYGAQGFTITPTGDNGSEVLGFLEKYNYPPLYQSAFCDIETISESGSHIIGTGDPGYDGILDKINLDLYSPLQWKILNPNNGINTFDVTVYPSGSQLLTPVVSANGVPLLYLMKNGEPGNTGETIGTGMPWFDETGFLACPNQTNLYDLTSFSTFNLVGASGAGSLLPVELLYFNAFYNEKKVELNWATMSEHNNDFFLIERSHNTMNFTSIAKLNSKAEDGSSNTQLFYLYNDNDISGGTYYYRLKQHDLNGAYKYSDIISVMLDDNVNFTIQPNPAKDFIEISYYSNHETTSTLKIYDNRGCLIQNNTLQCMKGRNLSSLDISHFTIGMYTVTLITDHAIQSIKLMKQ